MEQYYYIYERISKPPWKKAKSLKQIVIIYVLTGINYRVLIWSDVNALKSHLHCKRWKRLNLFLIVLIFLVVANKRILKVKRFVCLAGSVYRLNETIYLRSMRYFKPISFDWFWANAWIDIQIGITIAERSNFINVYLITAII